MKKNYLKRLNYKNLEKQNLILKILSLNRKINKNYYSQLRHFYGKHSSITVIRNNCINTNRNNGVLSNYKLSRLQFKKLAREGFISGIRKC